MDHSYILMSDELGIMEEFNLQELLPIQVGDVMLLDQFNERRCYSVTEVQKGYDVSKEKMIIIYHVLYAPDIKKFDF